MANPQIKAIITAEDRASGVFSKFQGSLAKSAKVALALATTVGVLAVKNLIKFEQRMSDVSTLVDTSRFDMDRFGDSILKMTRTIPKSADELGAAAYKIVSAGITDTSKALEVLETSAKLAVAGLGTVEEATNIMSIAMNNFGSAGYSADKIANLLFMTVKTGITTVGELTGAFGKLAPMAKAAGVTLEEMMAATAALSTVTADARMSQIALKSLFDELTRSGTELSKAFEDIGIENVQLKIKSDGLKATLLALYDSVDRDAIAFKNLFGNVRAGQAALLMIDAASNAYDDTLSDMGWKTNLLEEAFRKQADTTKNKLVVAQNQMNELLMELATIVLPILNKTLKGLVSFINKAFGRASKDAVNEYGYRIEELTNEHGYLINELGKAVEAKDEDTAATLRQAIQYKLAKENTAKLNTQISLLNTVLYGSVSESVHAADALKGLGVDIGGGIAQTGKAIEALNSLSGELMGATDQIQKNGEAYRSAMGSYKDAKKVVEELANGMDNLGEGAKASTEEIEKAAKAIEGYIKEIDKLYAGAAKSNLEEQQQFQEEAAQRVVEAEENIGDIQKELTELAIQYEKDKAQTAADGNNQQLRDLEERYNKEVTGLKSQKEEEQSILDTYHLHENELIAAVEDQRNTNSLNELQRLYKEHNLKISDTWNELQAELSAVEEKIKATVEEGIAKRGEIEKTKDTAIAAIEAKTDAYGNSLIADNSAYSAFVTKQNSLTRSLIQPSMSPYIPGMNYSPYIPPPMAEGGIVHKPTLAMIGESGPEAVIPLNKGLGGFNITITGNTFMSDDEAAVKIGDMIINELKLGNRI